MPKYFKKIFDLLERAKTLDSERDINEILNESKTKEFVVDLNKVQLHNSIGTDSNLLPKYTDDPYWKGSIKAAEKYEAIKAASPYGLQEVPERMNFRNSEFGTLVYAPMEAIKVDEGLKIDIKNDTIKSSIDVKTNNKTFGLTKENLSKLADEIRPILIKKVRGKIFIKAA